MDSSDLPIIVIKVNINCCESCPQKLRKLLTKTQGVESFDMAEDSVTIKGHVNPQKLVKNIAKALNKKKSQVVHYEVPKKEDSPPPPNPHYSPPQSSPRHRHYEDEGYRRYEGYNQDMYRPMQHGDDMAPQHQSNSSYSEARHVPSTNNASDYFSDENASGCVIM